MTFTWDPRKAKRNERIHGISFALAQGALESGFAVPVEEQYRSGEWRTVVVGPIYNGVLISIVIAQGDEDDTYNSIEEDSTDRSPEEVVVRIISARRSSPYEQKLYVEASPPHWG